MSYSRAEDRMAYPGGGFQASNVAGKPPSLVSGGRPTTFVGGGGPPTGVKDGRQVTQGGGMGIQHGGGGGGSTGQIPPGGPPGGLPGGPPGGLPGGPPGGPPGGITSIGRSSGQTTMVSRGGERGYAVSHPNQPALGVQPGSGPPGATAPSSVGGRPNDPPMGASRPANVMQAPGNQAPGQRMQPPGYSHTPPGGPGMGDAPIGSAAVAPTPLQAPPQRGLSAMPHQAAATGMQMAPGAAAAPVAGYGADSTKRNVSGPGPVPGSVQQRAPPTQPLNAVGRQPTLPPPGTHPSGNMSKVMPGQQAMVPPPPPSYGTSGNGPPQQFYSKSPTLTSNQQPAGPPQFFSVASGKPTPVASSGPPTASPRLAPPPAPGPPTSQLKQMSLGTAPPPQGQLQPPPLAMPGTQGPAAIPAALQAPFYAPPQTGALAYQGAPSPGGIAPGQAGAGGVPPIQQLDSQLPTLRDIDITIQADRRVMELSASQIPNSSSAAQYSKVPLCCVVQPMAQDMDTPDGGIPLVNLGAQGIVRCKRCRIYINPFVSWINNGRQWRCNACGMVNDVPASYFCHLDDNGYRHDRSQRPELSCGSVEFVAPSEYMVRPPVAPVYLFCLDVSAGSVSSGMLATAIATIKGCLDNLPGGERTQIGFITFDKSIHFYNLKSTLSQPQMHVVSDVNDFLLPCPEDLLVNLSESRSIVDSLLDLLPNMFGNNRSVDIALGPAINASAMVMQHIGGKLCIFCSGLPSLGEGKLKLRENPRLLGTDQEYKLFKPDENYYEEKAVDFSKFQICVELFLFNRQYQDVATLSQLPSKTAGNCFYYPGFVASRDGEKFSNELRRVLTRPTAFEAVMRVRATRGIRCSNFHGNYFIRGNDLLSLPNCSPDSVFVIELCIEDHMLATDVMSMQAALLYTTSGGERRIRVHNIAVPVQAALPQVINSVNIDILSNLIAKHACDIALRSGLDAARSNLQQICVDILRAGRGGGYGSTGGPGMGQEPQTIPESMQLLPLFTMSLVKNVCFRGGADVRSDDRSFMIHVLNNMPVSHSRCFIYPRMFSLHNMPQDAGLSLSSPAEPTPTAGNKNVKLPPIMTLSAERLTTDGIFLLENGVSLLLWVGRGVDPKLLQSLLGVPNLGGIDTSTVSIQRDGDSKSFAWRVCAIVDALREERIPWLQVHVTGEGDQMKEYKFMQHLVEDRANFPGGGANYPEWMQLVQRQSLGGI